MGKKKGFADKMAEKAFQSPNVQKSWQAHMQAFGLILEPAFAEDFKARIHLTNALNHLSRYEFDKAFKLLRELESACIMEADRTAWVFFLGLLFDMTGNKDDAISCYLEANESNHRFYMPYLKLAKMNHDDALFEEAEKNYRKAIECLEGMGLNQQTLMIAGSIYTNLASCLTMMHFYEEAEEALVYSHRWLERQPGREATEAILYAAQKNPVLAKECVEKLQHTNPNLYAATEKMVVEILTGKHAHFSEVSIEKEKLIQFWKDFMNVEAEIRENLKQGESERALTWFEEHLTPLFPFMERALEYGILTEESYCQLELADFFSKGLMHGYQMLLECCPEEAKEHWKFVIIH